MNAHLIILGIVVAMGTSIVGCRQADRVDSTADTFSLGGTRLSESQVAGHLRSAGFPENIIPTMVCTAKWESSFYTGATNTNYDGSQDTGLFQINDTHLGDLCDATRSTLQDPSVNARCAYKIYSTQGLGAWYGYGSHRGECDSYSVSGGSSGDAGGSCNRAALDVCLKYSGGSSCYAKHGCSNTQPSAPNASCDRNALAVCQAGGGGNACYARSGCSK